MSEPEFDVARAQRWFAIELNNHTWNLLEKSDRTAEETARMVHAAHASCHHWLAIGTPVNHVRALVQVTYAHAAAGDGDAARRHATQLIDAFERHKASLADWDAPFVYDSCARTCAAAGEPVQAGELYEKATLAAENVAAEEDRAVFLNFLAKWPFRATG